jgi:hypothetical protein
MSTLTDTQREILAQAASADDGCAPLPADAKVQRSLIKLGLMIALPRPGEPSVLTITDAGRQAIGAPPPAPAERPGGSAAEEQGPGSTGKLQSLIDLLRREDGASLAEMTGATGWQPHSVRGAMSGALKKTRGLAITTEKANGERRWKIAR